MCGNEKVVTAQDLKRGTVISCGCYQSYKGKQIRNKKFVLFVEKSLNAHHLIKQLHAQMNVEKNMQNKELPEEYFLMNLKRKFPKRQKEETCQNYNQ